MSVHVPDQPQLRLHQNDGIIDSYVTTPSFSEFCCIWGIFVCSFNFGWGTFGQKFEGSYVAQAGLEFPMVSKTNPDI